MKILITGAHFTPAQAVIEIFKKKNLQVIYVGRNTTREGDSSASIESQVLPKLGVKFIPITTGRLQINFTLYTLIFLLKILIGLAQAFYILLREKPDVVLSFGGYVAVPTILAAYLLSIPIIVHEQTLVTGLANQISQIFATKYIHTGNPIRDKILHPEKQASSDVEQLFKESKKSTLPIIFITGGNQGSHIINETISQIVEKLVEFSCVIHQTGNSKFNDWEKLEQIKKKLKFPQRYLVKKWFDAKDMGVILSKVDLTISRAGINSLYEFIYHGLPAILVPIPYLYRDEQNKNAQYFSNLGMGEIISQHHLNSTILSKIKQMLTNLDRYKQKAKDARSLVIEDGAQKLALETILLANAK